MTDQPRGENENTAFRPPAGDAGRLPASVIFMEMMRQAAAESLQAEVVAKSVEQDGTPALVEAPAEIADQLPAELPEKPPFPPSTAAAAAAGQANSDDTETLHIARLEAQRVRRVQKRRAQRQRRVVGTAGGFVRTLLVVVISAGLMATILSWWTNPDSLRPELRVNLQIARSTSEAVVMIPPTGQPTPNWLRQIGIVSGHYGPENDAGAVCMENGVVTQTENEINFSVASRVVTRLRELGYSVDLLDEWDPRLENYQAAALVSIHANTCQDYGERVSGYLVAQAELRPEGSEDTRLRECIAEYYEQASQLERRFGLTRDMTDYHIFREINPLTPGSILELGFMLADRPVLTENPDRLAEGVVNGILCFLDPLNAPLSAPPLEQTPEATPPPS